MSEESTEGRGRGGAGDRRTADQAREARLAEALRANLRRRKAAVRAAPDREGPSAAGKDEDKPDGG